MRRQNNGYFDCFLGSHKAPRHHKGQGMNRVYAGSDATMTFTVTTGGTFSVEVRDARNRDINASVSETGGTATVTIADDAWIDGSSGFGFIQITRDSGGKSVEASERFRILPGIKVDEVMSLGGDYRY